MTILRSIQRCLPEILLMAGVSCLLGACLLVGGCTVGPDYAGPPDTVEKGRPFVRAAAGQTDPAPPDLVAAAQWWTGLRDPVLDQLEADALRASPDIAAATARLRQSRAQLNARRAELRPSTNASAIYLRSDGGSGLLGGLSGTSAAGSSGDAAAATAATPSGTSGSGFDFYDVGFDASWELDLFGGRRRAVQGAAAAAEARLAKLADAQVSLTADVARAYVMLRDLQQRSDLARGSAALQERTLALTRQRAAAGTASDFDIERLQGQVEQTRADLLPLGVQIDEQLNQLAVLTGRAPGALDANLRNPAPIPLPPATVAVGDPAALIRRRPDVRAAERQLAARNAGIGQKIADYFPKVQILGTLGFSSSDIGQLFNGDSFSTLVAPVLSWKPFDFGRTAAAVAEARATRDEAEADYRGAVLKALGDAETALSRYGSGRDNVLALSRVSASADRAAVLARQRSAAGTATLIDTLDTERQRMRAEQALAQAKAELTQDFIRLQKSLGLGWQPSATGSPS